MVKKDIAEKLLQELEAKYQIAKKAEVEALNNALAEVIDNHKPDIQTLLYVLEMIKFEALSQKYGELFIKGGKPPLEIKPGD